MMVDGDASNRWSEAVWCGVLVREGRRSWSGRGRFIRGGVAGSIYEVASSLQLPGA